MSTKSENIEQLVFKLNSGTINTAELQVLLDWYNSHDDESTTIISKTDESYDQVKSRILANLLSRIGGEQPKPVRLYRKYRWLNVAAAILLIGLGTWIVAEYKNPVLQQQLANKEIKVGGNKATLTLPNGRKITLSSRQTGIVTGEKITYTTGIPVENTELDNTSERQQLTLHTPRGGTYNITLQDGTQVWLNAASTIKYPVQFASEGRIVELEGEAYFHVKAAYRPNGEKIPFRVISKQQQVEVLGTQFNMNTYADQSFSKTTLIEGKVSISDKNNHFILTPNEQAITSSGKTNVKQVETANYTAWRDGKFSFDSKTFEETMNDIARWYDLDIVYENGIPEEDLTGDAYRNENIKFVLRLLEVAEINFKLDVSHRKLTIKGKKNRM